MAMQTVGDVITQARRLVQDVDGTRWSDDYFYAALNMGILEAYRVRPDLFYSTQGEVLQYTSVDTNEVLHLGPHVPALALYVAGVVQLSDQEENSDARAAAYMQMFIGKLINHAA